MYKKTFVDGVSLYTNITSGPDRVAKHSYRFL